jgi:hypothetical protein
MTVNQERLLSTTDASVWAEEFMAEFGDRKQDIDEGLMIGWFANAIETGRSQGRKETCPHREFSVLGDDLCICNTCGWIRNDA